MQWAGRQVLGRQQGLPHPRQASPLTGQPVFTQGGRPPGWLALWLGRVGSTGEGVEGETGTWG